MNEHFCQHDHNLDEDCGKPASICIFSKKGEKLWLCGRALRFTRKADGHGGTHAGGRGTMRFKDIALPLAARSIKVIPVQPASHEGDCAETDAREKEGL